MYFIGTTSTHVEIQPPPVQHHHQQQQNQQTNKNQKNNKQNINNNNNNRKQSQPTVSVPATTAVVKSNNNSSKGSSNRSSSSPVPVTTKPVIELVKNVRDDSKRNRDQKMQRSADLTTKSQLLQQQQQQQKPTEKENVAPLKSSSKTHEISRNGQQHRKSLVFGNSTRSTADDYEIDYFKPTSVITQTTSSKPKTTLSPTKVSTSSSVPNSASKQPQPPREEEWKEVGGGKKVATSTANTTSSSSAQSNEIGCKKIQVPLNAISRVIGRGGSNINAIRAATGAHIEVEKQGKTQGDRSITIKGVPEATKQAHSLISTLIKDPDADILSMLPRNNFPSQQNQSQQQQQQVTQPTAVVSSTVTSSSAAAVNTTTRSSSSTNIISPSSIASINNGTSVWEKSRDIIPTVTNPVKPASYAAKQPVTSVAQSSTTPTNKTPRAVAKNLFSNSNTSNVIMRPTPTSTTSTKVMDKKGIIASNGPPKLSSTNVVKNSSFAAQLGGNSGEELPAPFTNPIVSSATVNTTPTTLTRSITPIGPPTRNFNASPHSSHIVNTLDLSTPYSSDITSQIQSKLGELHVSAQSGLEYSLFDMGSKWSQEQTNVFHQLNVSEAFEHPPLQVDASILAKAPGYRGGAINSPVSSKTSSNSATPPSTVLATQAPTNAAVSQAQSSGNYGDMNVIKPIGSGQRQNQQQQNQQQNYRDRSLFEQYNNPESSFTRQMNYNSINPAAMQSRLNPKASAFSSSNKMSNNSQQQQQQQYGQQSFMNSSSNNNFLKSPGSQQSFQQRNVQQNTNTSSSRWFGDLGSFNDFSSRRNEALDMDSSLMSGNTSQMHQQGGAAMSPNNNSINGPNLSGLSTLDDLRKAPPPIGTERHNFNKFNSFQQYPNMSGNMDFDNSMINTQMNSGPPPNSWMDKSPQQQWQMPNVPIIPRSHYDTPASMSDYSMPPDLFQV